MKRYVKEMAMDILRDSENACKIAMVQNSKSKNEIKERYEHQKELFKKVMKHCERGLISEREAVEYMLRHAL